MKHTLLSEDHIIHTLTHAGVLLTDGHFGLASGRHSPSFIAKTNAGMDVALMEQLALELAKRFVNAKIDAVLVPGTGAISLGHALAWQLSVLTKRTVYCAFAMRPVAPGENRFALKRGFPDVVRGKNVLAMQTIDDSITLGRVSTAAFNCQIEGEVMRLEPLEDTCVKDGESVEDILTNPALTRSMVERVNVRSEHEIDVVLVEAGHDIAVGHALALEIGKMQGRNPRLVYAEKKYDGSLQVTHRPPDLGRTLRLLVGEDVVTSGGSLMETVSLGETIGSVVGMAALWNRGTFTDPRLVSLVTRQLPSFEPGKATCPQCAADVPINQQYGRGK